MKIYFYCLLFITGLLACARPNVAFAQASYEGQVIDKTTEAAIPFATIMLSKAKTGTVTNDQGYFNLFAAASIEKDSLVFTCVGYKTYRMPVSAYERGMFIAMQSTSTALKEVVIGVGRSKVKTLGYFSLNDLYYYKGGTFGWNYPVPLFAAERYAKLFEVAKLNGQVMGVDLGRWQPGASWAETQPGKNSKFKIHIMTVNPASGAPDSILFTKEVSLQDRSRKTTIKLDSAYIVLPAKKFFVAIEWLRVPYNEYILKRGFIRTDGRDSVVRNDGYDRMVYQPLLAQFALSAKALSWQMTNGVWSLFEHPKFELALSATVKY